MVNDHPWLLVGPWYRWPHPAVPSAGRVSAPALQKFASDNFVNEFLQQPQHSLKFDPEVDQVYALHFDPVRLLPRALASKLTSVYPRDADGRANPSKVKLVPTALLKLFLDTHSRHYIVVCELHCDLAGLPSAAPDKVCQAGFVVRRHFLSYPAAARPVATELLRQIVAVQAKLAELEETAPLRPRAARRRAEQMRKLKEANTWAVARAAALDDLKQKRAELEKWKSDCGAHTVQQGWMPGSSEHLGYWQVVEDKPEEISEAWYPLYPVFADPAVPDHDAAGRTLFFGVVPTSGSDTEVNGKARFDDRSVYEIRCFARRHDPHCPREFAAPDCHGEVVWSLPTCRYQLASQFDLEGTSNRPITIQMPSLPELAAQAMNRPLGRFSPVKVIQPQGLNPVVDGKGVSDGKLGGFQICFFSIPLITLVAMFVLNIFLPILVFLFGLWFLLAFKFCIPPSLSLDLGIQAELETVGRLGLDVDASASASVEVTINGAAQTKTVGEIIHDLKEGIAPGTTGAIAVLAEAQGIAPNDLRQKMKDAKNSDVLAMTSGLNEASKLPQDAENDPPIGVDFSASLQFEALVKPEVTA